MTKGSPRGGFAALEPGSITIGQYYNVRPRNFFLRFLALKGVKGGGGREAVVVDQWYFWKG